MQQIIPSLVKIAVDSKEVEMTVMVEMAAVETVMVDLVGNG